MFDSQGKPASVINLKQINAEEIKARKTPGIVHSTRVSPLGDRYKPYICNAPVKASSLLENELNVKKLVTHLIQSVQRMDKSFKLSLQ